MKTFVFILFLCFCLWAGHDSYATNNILTANYPATNGTYNKIVLENFKGSPPDCSSQNNQGMLFMDTSSNPNTLKICANGQSAPVPYPETCFNRFVNATAANPNAVPTCPAPYAQANLGTPYDSFTTDPGPGGPSAGGAYIVNSIVCCQGSTVTP